MMENQLLQLIKAVENKEYLHNKIFNNIKNIVMHRVSLNTDFHQLLDLLLKYLENYPQQISLLQNELFYQLVAKKELHPLVFFLASRNDTIKYDLDLYLDNLPVEKFVYLMSAFYKGRPSIIFDPVFVMNIKTIIDIYNMLVESPEWFKENGDFFNGLHVVEFDENECEELFTKLKTDWSALKITKTAVSFVDLVASKCNKELEFIEFLITILFALPPENDDVTWLSNQIINNFKLLEINCPIQISNWEDLTLKCIKYSLKEENPEYGFIRVFRRLIKKAVTDKSIVSKSFELLAGHSQFSTIMLSRDAKQSQKEEVLRLIETLVKKEPAIMAVSHVPLFLCSYNASLTVNDQLLLRILFQYEANAIPMSDYRPYLWGSFAVSHYQVKNHLTSKTLNSYPSTTEILCYIPLKRLKETISCFPINRGLHIKNQKIIRYDISDSKDPSQMFDPAFFLPMISSLLATEAPLSIEKFNSNGCLSFVLACLGSSDSPLRSAAYHVLTLLKSHLFCRRAENMFWNYFLSWVARGIQDLRLTPPPRLPMIQALFLGRIVLAIANHEKSVEPTCCKVLLARPNARLHNIPELKTFLTSFSGPKEKSKHTHWFFEIIRDGIRSKNDWLLLKKMDLLNIFIVLFSCGSTKDRILILRIMKTVFCMEPATNGGTGPWALSLMLVISKYPNQLSAEEIMLVFQCLQSLSGSSFIKIPATDFWLYIFLEYGDKSDICIEGFITLKNLVSKFKEITLTETNLKDVLRRVENSKVLSDSEVLKCQSALKYGVHGMKIEDKLNSYLFLPSLVKILKAK